jgi:uncharacterized membrane protein
MAMRVAILLFVFFCASCTLPDERKAKELSQKQDTTVIDADDSNAHTKVDTTSIPLQIAPKVKLPNGIYQTVVPLDKKVEQTIAFNSDLTYQLQEKYNTGETDTVVTSEGTWTPSDGYIWLYKDQIVGGRYRWKGDVLQYYSPLLKKSLPMHPLNDAMQNTTWKKKARSGTVFFGTGNEPFWNVELDNNDSLSFSLAGSSSPRRMKIDTSYTSEEAMHFTAHADSTQLLVTIFPHFCSDGMSDFTYRNKVSVQLNKEVYNGCGILFRR